MTLKNTYINKIKTVMKTTNKRKLNRLIRECYEEGYGEIEPVSMALLTIEEIIDLIMITVAALKSEDFVPVVSERQKAKVKRKLYEASNKRRYRLSIENHNLLQYP